MINTVLPRLRTQLMVVIMITSIAINTRGQQNAEQVSRPVSMDRIKNGSLFVLNSGGTVQAIDNRAGRPKITGSFSVESVGTAIDIVIAEVFGRNQLFVALNTPSGASIFTYSVDGQVLHSPYHLEGPISGIDYDRSAKRRIFCTSANSRDIYAIDTQRNTPAYIFATLPLSSRLGRILVDETHNRLLVADTDKNEIDAIDLDTQISRVLLTGLRGPQGMVLSLDGRNLYIAEALGRDVAVVHFADRQSTLVRFSAFQGLKNPTGIAPTENGIAVADDVAKAIFFFREDGSLLYSIP